MKRLARLYRALRLRWLLWRVRNYTMTAAEREEQRRDWAYGNVKLSNPAVTRELVDRVADAMIEVIE